MVVIGIFRSRQLQEQAIPLLRANSDAIYEEKIAEDATLLLMRAETLNHAELLRSLLTRAGAQAAEIDYGAA